MRRLLLITGITALILAVASPSLAVDPVGLLVERADGRPGVDRCRYCGRTIWPGPVHRQAEVVMEDRLKEKMREKGIAYTEGKEYKRYVHVYLYRYEERRGGNFAVERPASVGLHVHLMEGNVALRVYEFDEVQRPLSENLLDLGKFIRRGGRWITAEQLAGEGIDSGLNYVREALEE
jgi:hypothetical protein